MPDHQKTTAAQRTMNVGGNTVGIGFGNAVAYFLIWWVGMEYEYKFDDPLLALAMGGTVISTIILEVKDFFRWVSRTLSKLLDR